MQFDCQLYNIRYISRHSGGTVSATDVSNVGIEMSGMQRKHINSPGSPCMLWETENELG